MKRAHEVRFDIHMSTRGNLEPKRMLCVTPKHARVKNVSYFTFRSGCRLPAEGAK